MDFAESQHMVKADNEKIRCGLAPERNPRTINTKGLRQTPLTVNQVVAFMRQTGWYRENFSSLRHLNVSGTFLFQQRMRG